MSSSRPPYILSTTDVPEVEGRYQTKDVLLLVGGEANKADNRIFYPQHAHRRMQMPWSRWWDNVPLAPPGLHDGLPVAMRGEPDPEEP